MSGFILSFVDSLIHASETIRFSFHTPPWRYNCPSLAISLGAKYNPNPPKAKSDSSLVHNTFSICKGSNKYLENYGMPKTIADLNKHKFISYGKGAPSPVFNPDWALKLGVKDNKKRKPVMKVNSVMGLLLAVESGVGLAALPDYLVSQSNNVVKVLPKSEGPITEAHFVYPQSLKNIARVQAFRNFLYSKLSETKF